MMGFGKKLNSAISILGRECIYKERSLMLHAKIRAVKISGEGVCFTFDNMSSIGFDDRPIKKFKASCPVDQIVIGEDDVSSPMVGWSFYLRTKSINDLIVFARGSPEKMELFERFRKISRARRAVD